MIAGTDDAPRPPMPAADLEPERFAGIVGRSASSSGRAAGAQRSSTQTVRLTRHRAGQLF
jgi:hypothetical protein